MKEMYLKSIPTLKTLIYFILLISCTSNKNNNQLKFWIEDNKKMQAFYTSVKDNDCEKIIAISEKINTDHFKIQTYIYLAKCYLDINPELSKKYLLKSVESGFHPSRIDSTMYVGVYNSIKSKLLEAQSKYWKSIDTTYFQELEKRIELDQTIRIKAMADPSDEIHKQMHEIDKDNQDYLLNLCKKYGYPSNFYPSNFSSFRVITPSVIVNHSPDSLKLVFLNYALNELKQQNLSWQEPISISNSLFISGISYKEVYPLWLTYFDKKEKLDVEKSYLQLYSIKKLFDQDMVKKIKIQPSIYNKNDKDLINKQLEEIKNILINEFSFYAENISISDIPDNREIDYRETASYGFTLSVFD